jgi:microcystin-dependent protein
MSDPFIGQINIFGFNFAPVDWQACNGALLGIAQNQALFALLGATYGGDGRSTFGIPNLQGRFPMGMGNGAGLTPRPIGQLAGTESVTLTANNLPAHTHATQISASTGNANSDAPSAGAYLAKVIDSSGTTNPLAYNAGGTSPLASLASGNTSSAGNGQPAGIMNPFLALNFCIAITGIFPSRP